MSKFLLGLLTVWTLVLGAERKERRRMAGRADVRFANIMRWSPKFPPSLGRGKGSYASAVLSVSLCHSFLLPRLALLLRVFCNTG